MPNGAYQARHPRNVKFDHFLTTFGHPVRGENRVKLDQNVAKRWPKSGPKWSKIKGKMGAKTGPKWVKKGSKMGPIIAFPLLKVNFEVWPGWPARTCLS